MTHLISLSPEKWYAWDTLSTERIEGSRPSTPIFITGIKPMNSGKGILRISLISVLNAPAPRRLVVDVRIVHHRADHFVGTFLDSDKREHTVAVSNATFEWFQAKCNDFASRFPPSVFQRSVDEFTDDVVGIDDYLSRAFGRCEDEILTANSMVSQLLLAPDRSEWLLAEEETHPTFMEVRYRITLEQVRFFTNLVSEFIAEASNPNRAALRDLASYSRLVIGAYATGFVFAAKSDDAGEVYQRVSERPHLLLEMPFREVRLYIHNMMRGERWSDMGLPEGGGHISGALERGNMHRLVKRLKKV